MKYLLTFLILLNFSLIANEADFEKGFLEDLNDVSEIATKTKLNIDDTPSFVTILHSNKLVKLGIDNVFEALRLVPGVQLTREASGVPIVIFRGATQKGEVKLMVDGVTINNAYRGSIYYYFDFPIELVKRIEVIRGAGSVLYGSGAISGVINIITKSSDKDSKNKVFTAGGTYDNYKGGALVSTDIKDFRLSLDTYYQKNNKTVENSDRHLKDYSVGINLSNDNLSFIGRIKSSDTGNAYGVLGILDNKKDSFYNKNRSIFTQLSYKNSVSENNKINVIAGYNNYQQLVEAGSGSSISVINTDYMEDSLFSEINLISKSIEDNNLLVGVKFESSDVDRSAWTINSLSTPSNVNPNSSRNTTSMYINDDYQISDSWDMSAGLRYDNYSDVGDSYSPNLGLVYGLNSKTKFKMLYSHAFRAPSWVEIKTNSNLNPETSQSIEGGIIFKQNQENTLRVNVFRSNIKDMIVKDSTGTRYIQNAQNNFTGTELEYNYLPNNEIEINLLASYIKAEDENGNDLANVANALSSASLVYDFNSYFSFGSLLKYVSKSQRAKNILYDQSISYRYKKITASIVVKDLFDTGTYYALPSAYARNFNDGGRTFLLKASVEF